VSPKAHWISSLPLSSPKCSKRVSSALPLCHPGFFRIHSKNLYILKCFATQPVCLCFTLFSPEHILENSDLLTFTMYVGLMLKEVFPGLTSAILLEDLNFRKDQPIVWLMLGSLLLYQPQNVHGLFYFDEHAHPNQLVHSGIQV